MQSPVTGSTNTKFIEKFSKDLIINKYNNELKLDVSKFLELSDDLELHQCLDTGYRFYYPFSVAGDPGFYNELQKKISYYNPFRWEHKIALRFIKRDENILEIGCGEGYFLKILEKKGIRAKGIEYNEEAIKKAEEKGLTVLSQSIQEYSLANSEKMDIVCFFQVLEHIADINSFLVSSLMTLKKGGKLIIGVPNNNPYLYKWDKYHLLNLPPHHSGLWNRKSLLGLAKVFNLQVKYIKTEPLFHMKEQLMILADHHGLGGIKSALNIFPSKYFNLAFIFLRPFFKGRNIVAVFIKK